MLKKSITFKDLDENDVTEDFYFNLNKAEIAELELSIKDGLSEYLQKIIKAEDSSEIIRLFKKVLLMSVGKRSEDGKRFVKNDEIRADFEQTDAYSVLFMELLTDAKIAGEFIKGIVPKDLQEQIDDLPEIPTNEVPAWIREDREPTSVELQSMTQEQLREAFARREARAALS